MQWLHTVNTADREGDWRKATFFETPTEAHLFFVKHDTAANRMRKKSDAASWVSAHTMSSSRPCRLGRCFPGPPTLDHRSRTGCTAAPRRRCITRSRSSRCIHGGETLGLLLSGSAHPACSQWRTAVTTSQPPTFGQGGWRRAEFCWSFQCTFPASAAGPLKAAATMGWISTVGPPPRPRLGRLAPSSYFQPHVKQGPRGLKGGVRGVGR